MPIPDGKAPFSIKSTKEKVYQVLREWIIQGVLKPKEQIYDSKLADYFQTSRTPIREAILLLESEGLVVINPGKSTVVSELDINKIKEWYLPLASLQGLAVEIACDIATKEQIYELRKCNKKFIQAVETDNVMAIINRDFDFHMMIAKITGNRYIISFCNILLGHIARIEFTYFSTPNIAEQSIRGHIEIIDLIEKRDKIAGEKQKESWLRTMYNCENKLYYK